MYFALLRDVLFGLFKNNVTLVREGLDLENGGIFVI